MVSSAVTVLAIGEILKDTYRLEKVLARGGMGVVFEASHLWLDRRFAIKLLSPDAASDETALERFKREALVTSRLGHPNIVEVTDFGITSEGIAFLVMERLQGESLAERLARRGRLSPGETASIVRQVSSALQAAHQLGVVHRDLKPENILLCAFGERLDHVKVLDFGISKLLNVQTIASAHSPLGSPGYMAPEQAHEQDEEVGPATDVYALAAMAFHMLAGAPPFQASSPLALLYKIANDQPPSLRSLQPDLPLALEQLLSSALSKRPSDRPASMAELWERFEVAMAGSGSVASSDAEPRTTVQTRTDALTQPLVQIGTEELTAPSPPGPRRETRPSTEETEIVENPMFPPPAEAPPEGPISAVASEAQRSSDFSDVTFRVRPSTASGRSRAIMIAAAVALLGVAAAVVWIIQRPGGGLHVNASTAPDAGAPRVDGPRSSPDLAGPRADASATADQAVHSRPDRGRRGKSNLGARPAELRVAVSGVPPARVYVDGKFRGETPFIGRVLAGKHRVMVRTRDGRSSETRTLLLRPAAKERVEFRFAPR